MYKATLIITYAEGDDSGYPLVHFMHGLMFEDEFANRGLLEALFAKTSLQLGEVWQVQGDCNIQLKKPGVVVDIYTEDADVDEVCERVGERYLDFYFCVIHATTLESLNCTIDELQRIFPMRMIEPPVLEKPE